jgi:hypothetical protein
MFKKIYLNVSYVCRRPGNPHREDVPENEQDVGPANTAAVVIHPVIALRAARELDRAVDG